VVVIYPTMEFEFVHVSKRACRAVYTRLRDIFPVEIAELAETDASPATPEQDAALDEMRIG